MMRWMNIVTDKPGWTTKVRPKKCPYILRQDLTSTYIQVFDDTIVEKWRSESVTEPGSVPEDREITPKMFDYCIAELRYRASKHESSPGGAIHVFSGDVYKSDTAVSEATKLALQRAIKVLEDVPASQKDWHPGSNGQVLDLVHPSLFPLVYGKTRVLPVGADETNLEDCVKRSSEGEVLELEDSIGGTTDIFSNKFQWLPCEVDISGEKPRCDLQHSRLDSYMLMVIRIITYINNLHPHKHTELYSIIEDVIGASLDLWNLTLAPLVPDSYRSIPTPFRRIKYDSVEYDPYPDVDEDVGPQKNEGESERDYWDRRYEWECGLRRQNLVKPEPEEFKEEVIESSVETLDLKEKFGGRLQVIVKLANIELTPEKPKYEGGTWHVEGKMVGDQCNGCVPSKSLTSLPQNDAICATAIYYLSSSNITPSSLAFRQQSEPEAISEVSYEQGQHEWLTAVFGLTNWGNSVQNIGSVQTPEGRLITFPNILQHQVQPFELEDKTKPGHRKILALFLVDPHVRILSTADVPVQRADWWSDEVMRKLGEGSGGISQSEIFEGVRKGLAKLPVELKDKVLEEVDDFPIGWADAKKIREELMEERKSFVLKQAEEYVEGQIISLCEH